MNRAVCAVLAALLLAALPASCAARPDADAVPVYFRTGAEGESALAPEYHCLPEGEEPIESLLALLMAGPENESLSSPLPPGTTLRGWNLENGVLTVNLSAQYSALSGVSLTLADYSFALTLCQLEGVDSVNITAGGRSIPYRSRELLSPGDLYTESTDADGEPAADAP